jgi:hypothetical protein
MLCRRSPARLILEIEITGRPSNGVAHDKRAPLIRRELSMIALQGWILIGLLVLITLGIVGLGAEIQALPYLWRAAASEIK